MGLDVIIFLVIESRPMKAY